MTESKTPFDALTSQIKNNPIVASLILLGSVVIALSTFTDAAKNLWSLVAKETRPDINGEWKADVTYDWPNAQYVEIFTFRGDGDELHGTASFLGTVRGILTGTVKKDKIQFITRRKEIMGSQTVSTDLVQRYQGKIAGDEITFMVQIEGGVSGHVPIEFTARRLTDASGQQTR